MSSYLYELPTTGAISYADVCVDFTATYTADIADTTEARANLRATLKESKRTDQGEKDYLKLVKVSSHIQCDTIISTLRGEDDLWRDELIITAQERRAPSRAPW